MSHYRDLNKELIGQVQKMRLDMRSCFNEIVRLKEELMEKHESEVNLRKQCYSWAVNSFVQLMQSVQPDSEILPILKEYGQPREEVYATSSSADGRTHSSKTMGRRSSEARRSSTSILAKEMQRSNSVINIRKSIRRTSPIRGNSKEHSDEDEEEQNSQFVQHGAEVTQKLINSSFRNTIYEYSVEEEEEEDLEVFDVESVCESIEEPASSHAISTLKDITNTLAANRNSSQQENILSKTDFKRTRDKKSKSLNVSHQKNTKHIIDNEDESFQELRRYSKEETLVTNRSIPIKQDSPRDNEVNVDSPTLVYTDITLRNFKNAAACSTPNSLHNSLLNVKSPAQKDEYIPDLTSTASVASANISARRTRRCKLTNFAEPEMGTKQEDEYTTDFTSTASMESGSISARPTRRCKPTNLAEPNLASKLRNESESGYKLKKGKTRSKSKTKK